MYHRNFYSVRPLLCGLVICIASFLGSSVSSMGQMQIVESEVPFITLRNRTESVETSQVYGDERSDLKAGWCQVRARDLGALSSLPNAVPAYFQEQFLVVDEISETKNDTFFDAIREQAAGTTPLLYIHGYNLSFEKGCRRAALLQQNVGMAGRFVWFSWPSDGILANYTRDEVDLYWSVPDLADVILQMAQQFQPQAIDVAGHSLGARGLVLALYEVANRRPETRLGNIVLLAPDMDFEIFRRILPRISPIAANITIYVTKGDYPLTFSAQLHGYPRLGESGNDVSKLPGVEVIDLSDLPSESPTGHLYHIYSPAVGADLAMIFKEKKRAADREGLVPDGINLWRLQQAVGKER